MQVGDFVYGDYALAVLDGLGGPWNIRTVNRDGAVVTFGIGNPALVSMAAIAAAMPMIGQGPRVMSVGEFSGDEVRLTLSDDPEISARVARAIISYVKAEVARYVDEYDDKIAENNARTSRSEGGEEL